ncbi:MAG: efflux RND transporter permease subunit [Proteobacteria bacterium]|nr:efflux RND transporter permease subunit [Pseudomonadota bacterium]
MNLTRAAIERDRVTLVAVVLIVFAGLLSFFSLPQAKDPGFLTRTAQITTIFPGASPERVEMLVTDKIENAVQEIAELDFISSTSKTSVSVVMVNIKEKYTHLTEIWDDLRRKVDNIRPTLPAGILGPTINDNFGEIFGIVIGVTGEGISQRELKDIADEVRDQLLLIEEVAKVNLSGAQEERIFVEYNNARLAQLGLSPSQLNAILERRNIIIPGGDISTGVEDIVIEPSGNFESIDDLRRTVIQLPGRSQVTYLGDIVDIRRAYVDPPEYEMRTNGVPSIGLAISLRAGSNIVELGEKVSLLLEQLPDTYPHGIDFDIIHFEPAEVKTKVDDFVISLLQSIGMVMLVMLVFLGVRTGLVVSSLIPITMLAALVLMSVFDIGLDQISLASLIIALGMLADNAIVVTESIMVKMEEGEEPIAAAVSSAKELRISLLTSSLTTCVAFLPIFLAESAVGEYTSSIFKVVSISLLSSWVLALTMTPLMAVTFLSAKRARQKRMAGGRQPAGGQRRPVGRQPEGGLFLGMYRWGLIMALKLRYISVLVVVAGLVVSMRGFAFVPKKFFPPDDVAQINATFRMPPGSTLTRTQDVITRIERFIAEQLVASDERPQGVVNWGTFIGVGAPRYSLGYLPEPPGPEYAFILMNTTSPLVGDAIIDKLDTFTFDNFPDLEVDLKKPNTGPPVANPIEIRISGPDVDEVFTIVEQVKAELTTLRGPRGIKDDWGPQTKKLIIEVSQARAFRAGVTNWDIAVSLLANFTGVQTSEYREGDEIIPITMRSAASDRDDIGKLETLNIYAQSSGKSVPLKQVADAKIVWEPSKLKRRNRMQTVSVLARLDSGVTAAEIKAYMDPWLDGQKREFWEPGYRYEIGGVTEKSNKANGSIRAKMPIAGFIILMLLVMQFNSMRSTFIILFTIPLALIGVVIGLLAMESYFGFMTLLGIISLFGIVINNAIVLIERIKLEMEENGLTPADAIVVAAQRRLRPILLTTATTVGGLIPLWMAGGMWEPMAIAIIFGLMFSTVLTLGIVPALYAILYRVSFRGYR